MLTQVDCYVGGKTAVNHALGKNMSGAVEQPKAVLIDPSTLDSLPPKEFAAGMAEVIKYGIIYDRAFFDWLEANKHAIKAKKSDALSYMIARCCEIKAEIVNLDEKEHGVRALLNLGHTFGHAIEAEMGYGNWLHGEAVAVGMVQASTLALMRKQISEQELERIKALINYFELPLVGPESMTAKDYIVHMQRDKKVLSGNMRFILPIGIGKAEVVSNVSIDELDTLLS